MQATRQIQMVMRDMLFVTFTVQPDVLRKLVHERLEIDVQSADDGSASGFVSAVCFRVSEVRSAVLPLPRLNFEQVNYRAYVRVDDVPSVYFFDMRVNSRTLTTLTSFLKVPVGYEDIELTSEVSDAGHVYRIDSAGLRVDGVVGATQTQTSSGPAIACDFITQRLIGYASAGDGLFKLDVDHARLDAVPASVKNVQATRLEQLGLLNAGQKPCSAFYVREALFEASMPTRAW